MVVVFIDIHNKYENNLISIPYNLVKQVFISIKDNNRKKLIGSCHILKVGPMSVYKTLIKTVGYLRASVNYRYDN